MSLFRIQTGRARGARLASVAGLLGLALNAQQAQAQPPRNLYLGLDLAFQAVRDDTLVPLAFSGPRAAVVPRFLGQVGPGLLTAEARMGLGYALDREHAEALTLGWRLGASYLLPVHDASWHVALGPALGWENETFLLADWDDAHAYWIGARWLGPGVRGWRAVGAGWRLDLAGEAALIGLRSRPPAHRPHKQETSYDLLPYITSPSRDPQFGWIGDFQLLRASLELVRSAAEGVPAGWGFGAELGLLRASEPAPAFSFSASLRMFHAFNL